MDQIKYAVLERNGSISSTPIRAADEAACHLGKKYNAPFRYSCDGCGTCLGSGA